MTNERIVDREVLAGLLQPDRKPEPLEIGIEGLRVEQLLLEERQIAVGVLAQPLRARLGALGGTAHQCACVCEKLRNRAGTRLEEIVGKEDLLIAADGGIDLLPRVTDLGGQLRVAGDAGTQLVLLGRQAGEECRIEQRALPSVEGLEGVLQEEEAVAGRALLFRSDLRILAES